MYVDPSRYGTVKVALSPTHKVAGPSTCPASIDSTIATGKNTVSPTQPVIVFVSYTQIDELGAVNDAASTRIK